MTIFTFPDDLTALRSDRLVMASAALGGETISDAILQSSLLAAEKEIGRTLKVLLEPTQVFPYEPTSQQIATIANGLPWIEEAAYDYDADFFRENRWGYIVTRQHPIIQVQSISFNYPAPTTTIFPIPNDWQRLDKKFGHIRLVPASSQFTAPLGLFLLQALGGGGVIPAMLQVVYSAGLTDAKTNWPDLVDVIYKQAILNLIDGAFLPQSGSISADGMSQSQSFDASKYRDILQTRLMGPKGSNGGLWTAIHGIGGSFLGPTN